MSLNYINNLDDYYKYVLNVVCPFEIKDEIKKILKDSTSKIINSRLNVKVRKDDKVNLEEEQNQIIDLQSNIDIEKTFLDFLQTIDLKYPLDTYKYILTNIKK